ncbi:uncharacterized protein LOC133192023 [Saccostrea echinata]|uniref:uncharacterized protein LOC133192023 n=1 Tax=Saccostrea echinata TaxID=191078 RepID=UPI002A81ED8E|nr:uncharacterized protein LOC133192023 [Saccostrea echinata]
MSVLKPKHSLVGKSLVPVILKFKAQEDRIEECDLNRLKKGHSLTRYNQDELRSEFEGLTGENPRDILLLAGREEDFDSLVILMHFAIAHANLAGAPKGQSLVQTSTSEAYQTVAPVNISGAVAPSSSAATASTSSSVAATSSVSRASGDKNMETRLRDIEKKMESIKEKSGEDQVEECLRQVRILAGRPNLTQAHVLLAALETLVDVAFRNSHKDADFYSKAFTHCKKYENSKDLCGLTMKLFGSAEDKKIANVVADWLKGKKYEGSGVAEEKENVGQNNYKNLGDLSGMQANPYPYVPLMGQPQFPFSPYPMPYSGYPAQGFGFPRPSGRGMGVRPRRGRCLFCKDLGHFIADCPKMKNKIIVLDTKPSTRGFLMPFVIIHMS